MGTRRHPASTRALRICFAALLIFCAWSSNAAVQVLTISEAPSFISFPAREIELPQFNPSLGVLDSVSIDLRGTGAFIEGFNRSGGAGSHLKVAGQPGLTLTLEGQGDQELLSLSQRAGNYRWPAAPRGLRIEPVTVTGHTTLTSEADLMQFTGCGFVDLFLSARSSWGHAAAGGMSRLTGLWAAGADITVTYSYAAVPETATWLGAGLAVLLLIGNNLRREVFLPRS